MMSGNIIFTDNSSTQHQLLELIGHNEDVLVLYSPDDTSMHERIRHLKAVANKNDVLITFYKVNEITES